MRMLSECCGVPSIYEESTICSRCKDHSGYYDEDALEEQCTRTLRENLSTLPKSNHRCQKPAGHVGPHLSQWGREWGWPDKQISREEPAQPQGVTMAKSQSLKFEFEKETKSTFRYKEQGGAEGAKPVIGTLYIAKSFVGEKPAATATVTVELSDEVAATPAP